MAPRAALLLLLIAPLGASAQSPTTDTTRARAIDRLFAGWITQQTPGCAVGVSRNQQTVYEQAYGLANLETGTPITTGTIFEAASIAKQFTAMSVLLLAREGKLSLDDDVHRYIPELPNYGSRITIRNLLTHTSGLRDFFEMLILARGRFEENRISEADMLDIVTLQTKLNFRPGDEFLYSNTGYALLEVIVKRVADKSLRDFAAERIFGPLGMSSTQFKDDYTSIVRGRAQGYSYRDSAWHSSTPNYDVYGPTNLFSNVDDLLTWSANLDNPKVGDTTIVRQMSTSAVLNNGESANYGFGLSLGNDRGTPVIEHEGGDPGFHSYIGKYPQYGLSVVVLCNIPSNPVALGHQIAAVFLDSVLPKAPAKFPTPPSIALPPDALAKYVGVYFRPQTLEVVEMTVRNGELYSARQRGIKLVPIGDNKFAAADRALQITFDSLGYVAVFPERKPIRFERQRALNLTPASLAQYAGDYCSEELASRYRVTAADSTLLLTTGTSRPLVARPVFPDAFVIGQLTVQFIRDSHGVSGFEISHPRARRLAFTKISASGGCAA
jgi:CubicO group peptidase (beta-lactamase class C family)